MDNNEYYKVGATMLNVSANIEPPYHRPQEYYRFLTEHLAYSFSEQFKFDTEIIFCYFGINFRSPGRERPASAGLFCLHLNFLNFYKTVFSRVCISRTIVCKFIERWIVFPFP